MRTPDDSAAIFRPLAVTRAWLKTLMGRQECKNPGILAVKFCATTVDKSHHRAVMKLEVG